MPSLFDPTDETMTLLGIPGASGDTEQTSALARIYRAVTGAIDRGDRPASLLWSPDNPIGTERVGEQSVSMPRGEIDPVIGRWPTGKPMTRSEYRGIEEASLNLFDQASMAAPGATIPGVGGPRALASARRGRTTPLPPEPGGKVATPGFTNAPEGPVGTIHDYVAGRLGSNADDQLATLGLPTYADIVPSPNTGPLTPEQISAGAPQGRVFDLSQTYTVPPVEQRNLTRIDPDAGRRKGLPAHIVDTVNDPELAAKLRFVAEKGVDVGGAYWYNAEPLRERFISELGQSEGERQFNRYMSIVGATSAGSDVGQNVRAASYYLGRERQGEPVQSSADLISPYGHKMQQAHVSAYKGLDEPGSGGTLNPETQPKRSSFVENLSGNQEPVTVDKHNLRLIGMLSQNPGFLNTKTIADVNYPRLGIAKGESRNWRDEVMSGRISMDQAIEHPHMWQDVPDPAHYGALEGWQQEIARSMGLTPAQFQAALWVGGGRVTGLRSLPTSFMGTVENRLTNTAAKRGGTPEQALLDFIHNRAPLLTPLGLAAGAGATSLLGQENSR